MSDFDATPFERHARRFLVRLQKLARDFRTGSAWVGSTLGEFDKIRPQVEAAFAWADQCRKTSTTAAELCLDFAGCGVSAGGSTPLALRQSPVESRRWIEAALASSRFLRRPEQEAACLYQLAAIAFAEYEFAEARTLAEQALQWFRSAGHERPAATSLNLLGLVACADGRADAAVHCFEESLAVFRKLDLTGDVAVTLRLLARAHVRVGRFEECLRGATNARALSRQLEDTRGELAALETMAVALAGLGRREELNGICSEAVLLPVDEKTAATSVAALGQFDLVRLALPGKSTSASQLERDLAAFREVGNWNAEGFTLLGLGLAHAKRGERDTGRACLEQARAVFSKHEYALGVALSQKYLGHHYGTHSEQPG